ncbi:MAG: peroxidase family protein [Planctomycetota bacterium]
MRDANGGAPTDVPAGMIFLGQFVDHDITLDVISQLGEFRDPASIRNVRTPRLDLDSVYLSGPEGSPFLYASDGRLLTDQRTDFRRVANGTADVALIGDPRNDENGLIAQLHLLFLRFHNRMLAVHDGDFEEAQKLVRWHYQWIVRNEFLPAIVDDDAIQWAEAMAADDWHRGPGVWNWLCGDYRVPDMPVEFAAAAYRFGHSQVLDRYQFDNRAVELFAPPPAPDSLSSFGKVPSANVVTDWSWFFDVNGMAPNRAAAIDTKIAGEVFELPFAPIGSDERILPLRNLIRGDLTFALPTGEAAADYLGVPRLPENCGPIVTARAAGLDETPLWFYVLAEAEQNHGVMTGVGGRIVALTLIRMLQRDPDSYRNAATPWHPIHGTNSDFTMADLVRFTQQP